MRTTFITTCGMALLCGCMKQPAPDPGVSVKQVQAALDQWRTAFEAKNVDGVMAVYAPGAQLTAYDVVPPLQYKGADAYRKDYQDIFNGFDGPLHAEMRDTHIEVGGGLAVAYGLEHISGKLKTGQATDMWLRYTSVFKQIGGRWLDIHDHVSVPADLNSGKALTNLTP